MGKPDDATEKVLPDASKLCYEFHNCLENADVRIIIFAHIANNSEMKNRGDTFR